MTWHDIYVTLLKLIYMYSLYCFPFVMRIDLFGHSFETISEALFSILSDCV